MRLRLVAKRANSGRPEQALEVDAARPRRPVAQMKELDELREQGVLTEEEFVAEQKELLGT
jgi:putative oligomerization/nucleic acid binding protein